MNTTAFASPEIRALIRARVGQLGGVALAIGGLLLLLALVSYNPRDPSWNTATFLHPSNWVGQVGAIAADLLLQGFGLVAFLPVLVAVAWSWRLLNNQQLRLLLRLPSALLALLAAASVFGLLPRAAAAWPTAAGWGGAVGALAGGFLLRIGGELLGPAGAPLVVVLLLALGLTGGEWRAAGRGVRHAAAFSAQGAGGAARSLHGIWPRRRAFEPALPEPVAAPEPARRFGLRSLLAMGRRADDAAEPGEALEAMPAARLPAAAPPAFVHPAGGASEEFEIPVLPPAPPRPVAAAAPAAAEAKGPKVVPRPPAGPVQPSFPFPEAGWELPPMTLLKAPPARVVNDLTEAALQDKARLLESVLSDYGVQGAIREIRPGPVVTLYELEPAPGIRSARVIGLADDVARSLCVTAVRIATVPGRNVIGIEVPNAQRETVYLSELLQSAEWRATPSKLALALGKDISGAPVIADLARMPHLLIAGTTGSGKSVGINAMILSLLYRMSPDQCRLIMIDPKMLEFSAYEGIPHLLAPVVTEPAKAVAALKWTTREMERRYRAMSQLGVRNVGGYNEKVAEALATGQLPVRPIQVGFDKDTDKPIFENQALQLKLLPYIVVVIDEMADLMMVAGKEVEAQVQRLAQMARAAGIHVIMATQRPSVDVITGTIKANFPTRISFQVISKFDSRTILGEQGAEQLLGMGDLLHMAGGGRISRVHGPFVRDSEVEQIVEYLRAQAEPVYDDEITEGPAEDDGEAIALSGISAGSDEDKLNFDRAVAMVAREGRVSTSLVQRYLKIGYNRAASLVELMEKEGIVSAPNHAGKRDILTRRREDDDD